MGTDPDVASPSDLPDTEETAGVGMIGYLCDDCNRQWPSKSLPDSGETICPDCREDDDA